ncbi:hypothetical protein ANO11243_042750 [Dothideomycetidae sp. 11243]|nr:hypothetical protein ANO11243_042750 [fungal sp. No.11243]
MPLGDAALYDDKIIVTGKMESEDAAWIVAELQDWKNAIYSVDNTSAPLHTAENKGREANPYLTYLVENYDNLPAIIAFIHPHRDGYPRGWHNDAEGYSNVKVLQTLNLDLVLESGYVNLRCNYVPGCPDEIRPFRDWDDQDRQSEHEYGKIWHDLFGPDQEVPERIGTPCCAQFAVSREQVRARPKSDYVKFLNHLRSSRLTDAVLGRVFEYLWHIMFGKEAIFCPAMQQCYKDVFNRTVNGLKDGDFCSRADDAESGFVAVVVGAVEYNGQCG